MGGLGRELTVKTEMQSYKNLEPPLLFSFISMITFVLKK